MSQDCIQDDRQPFLRMWSRLPRELWNCVLKTWMLRDKKGFQNTGTRTAVWGLWEESLPHCIVGCTSYLWATKERPSTPSSSDALMVGTSPEVGDRYTGLNLSKQSTVEFFISGPRHLPEDPHKSPKFWNIPLKKNHPQDGQSPS